MGLLTVLRPANRQDCRLIHNAHRHVMQYICIRNYDERVLQVWEELLEMENYIEATEDKKKALWVVEYKGVVQGFFQADFKEAQLDALYVHPFVHNQGLGTVLLSRAEELAARTGLGFMKLYASSNSVPFYRLNGYESLGAAILPLNETVRVKCELMRKYL